MILHLILASFPSGSYAYVYVHREQLITWRTDVLHDFCPILYCGLLRNLGDVGLIENGNVNVNGEKLNNWESKLV